MKYNELQLEAKKSRRRVGRGISVVRVKLPVVVQKAKPLVQVKVSDQVLKVVKIL